MEAKLRQVGNSLGFTLPAAELKAFNARPGDILELEIKRVVCHARADWDSASQWPGADEESVIAEDTAFDRDEWQW